MEDELRRERSLAVVARLEKTQQVEAVKHDALIQFNKKMQQKVSLNPSCTIWQKEEREALERQVTTANTENKSLKQQVSYVYRHDITKVGNFHNRSIWENFSIFVGSS